MKLIELDQLKKMDPKKLNEELTAAKKDLFKVSFEVVSGQAKNSHEIKAYRKYIAKIQTLLNSHK